MLVPRIAFAALVLGGLLHAATPPRNAPAGPPAVVTVPEGSLLWHFYHGDYARVIEEAGKAVRKDPEQPEPQLLLARSLMETGQYPQAKAAIESAIARNAQNLQLRILARDIYRLNGDPKNAEKKVEELDRLGFREWAYTTPADRVALGQAALLVGADPKKVLDRFFDPVRKEAPETREVYQASGDLALEKGDFALAGRTFTAAAKRFPDDPDIQFGVARAYAESDVEAALAALKRTLEINPKHVRAKLLIAENHIDAERFPEAAQVLAQALQVNPARPETHALLSVVAELQGDPARAEQERAAALKPWPKNPEVEHLIGRKLSQKYRFAEGAAHQRKALEFDIMYLPAKLQLAQDLLRLGEDAEGWRLAAEVQKLDPYDVVAYNLVTLQEKTSHFQALESEHFLVRMEASEAAVYGKQVQDLLERAYAHLCAKYGLTPKKRTTVEIFNDQKDFAIRTFSLPGGAGYLGVCFGSVITANSPAARPGANNNWQAVLWHEFAHVVTLGLTQNRMPRWLSEGISVYEERQARGQWGEQMKARYRAMILGEDFVPLSELSGSFLRPKSPVHLQFAYYESSLAVEYLMDRYGLPAIKAVCADLAAGRPLNEALAKHCAPLPLLDAEFAARAKALAESTGAKLDWSKPAKEDTESPAKLSQWKAAHPDSYVTLWDEAAAAMKSRQWEAAKRPLQRLIQLYPMQHEPESAYALLARVYRELGDTDQERVELQKIITLSADAAAAHERLIEIEKQKQEWPAVLASADALAAINPLLPQVHRARAEAEAALQHPQEAIASYETLLKLDEAAPPETRFRLALQYRAAGQPEPARRRLLEALEEAPRNREALKVLREMSEQKAAAK